jgi:hypothetical protein
MTQKHGSLAECHASKSLHFAAPPIWEERARRSIEYAGTFMTNERRRPEGSDI